MTNLRVPFYVTTALVSGVLSALFAPAPARAECVNSATGSNSIVLLGLDGDHDGDFGTDFTLEDATVISLSNAIGGSAVTSLSSAVTALAMNDAAMTAQGSSPFVVVNPSQTPNAAGGGVWVRGVGGDLLTNVPSTGSVIAPLSPATPLDCQSRVRQGFGGFQVGADLANLNLDGSGGTLSIGITAGYMDSSNVSSGGLTNTHFSVPFAGIYAVYTHGNFFADTQIRGNWFIGSLSDQTTGVSGLAFHAEGFTLSANTGYHYTIPGNWFIEPSIGINFSETNSDSLNFFFVAPATTLQPLTTATFSRLDIDQFDSLLGRITVRVGTDIVNGQYTFEPYFTASVFHEFADPITSVQTDTPESVLATNPGLSPSAVNINTVLSTGRIGTFGQFGLGLAGQIAGTGLTGFVRGDYRVGDRFEGWSFAGGVRYNFAAETPVVAKY